MAEEQENIMSASENQKEDWMNKKCRPAMGWMYMIVCIFDFVLAPILWSLLQSLSHGSVQTQWQPLTLQGAGLFHIAMGAILGIAAYGRTQEKLNGANNGGLGTSYVAPAPVTSGGTSNGGFNAPTSIPAAGGFGNSGGFDISTSPASSTGSGTSSFGSSTGFGDTPTQIKPIVKRPGI